VDPLSTDLYIPQTTESRANHPFSATKEFRWLTFFGESADENPCTIESYRISTWCSSRWKRVFDLFCVIPALLVISPLLFIIAIAVRLSSPGPVFFCQKRAGRNRKLFTIYKFRTMVNDSGDTGSSLTAAGDPRITCFGKFLRRLKIDELPQLYNVLRGDMSLVGPRPKLAKLEPTSVPCNPGITGAATLLFRREQHLLRGVAPDRVSDFYAQYIAPEKARADAVYMASATFWSDLKILQATLCGWCHPEPSSDISADRVNRSRQSRRA
jgi:lipopolysaccharide/colanic/teichoic acid biosynthesis glycosyltransferase